jgi:hypothetical protein
VKKSLNDVLVSLRWSAVVLVLPGCSGSNASSVSCDVPHVAGSPTNHICEEYDEPTPADAMLAAQGCTEDEMGTVVASCPSQGIVGSCVLPMSSTYSQRATITHYYSDEGLSLADAQIQCFGILGGTWTSN